MGAILTMIKGFLLDKGGKLAAGTGAVAVLLALFDRLADREPASFCFTLDATGGMLLVAGLLVLVAFRTPPPGAS